jgi:hypothetical protein
VKKVLNWLAISKGSLVGMPLTLILSIFSEFLRLPRISFSVSQVFFYVMHSILPDGALTG